MAEGIGEPSEYLKSHVLGNGLLYLILVILCIAAALTTFIFAQSTFGKEYPSVAWVLFAAYLFVMWAIYKTGKYAFEGDTFMRGGIGEAVICDELDKLPREYKYFRGIKIANTPYDIDFVVIGPTGIFAIDAKSHNGNISYQNGKLLKNGKALEKDIIKQSKSQALFVHDLLKSNLNVDIFVIPVLVFSSHWAKMYFGFNKLDNVHVVQRKWLRRLILRQRHCTYRLDRRLIEQELDKLTPETK